MGVPTWIDFHRRNNIGRAVTRPGGLGVALGLRGCTSGASGEANWCAWQLFEAPSERICRHRLGGDGEMGDPANLYGSWEASSDPRVFFF